MSRVYLDHNATAPIRPQAAQAVLTALQTGGNPSSIHAGGRAARALLEQAREQVAALVKARPTDVVFTSGATEANNLAIESAALLGEVSRIIVGATEHPSVIECAMATRLPLEIWPVDADGVADLAWLRERLARWTPADGRPFACLMLANNETGVIQPVAEAAALIHAANGLLHVDAVQAAGKLELQAYSTGADTLALSAHKLGGPSGVGALVVCCGIDLVRRINGGGQERGRRGGTENLSGAAGFGAAAQAAASDIDALTVQAAWRDVAARRLRDAAEIVVLGEGASRLPNTLCFATPGFTSELQVMALDLAQVMVSSGSACSSGKVKASHVVLAMDREDLAGCVIRVSGGWNTTQQDWDRFADAWLIAHARHAARMRPIAQPAPVAETVS